MVVEEVPRAGLEEQESPMDPVDDGEELAALMEMGFSRAMCVAALKRCSSVNEAAEFLLLNQDLGMDEAAPVAPASSPALVRASHPEERLHTHYDGSDLEYPALGSRTSRAVTGKVLQPQAKRPAQTQLIEYPPTYSDESSEGRQGRSDHLAAVATYPRNNSPTEAVSDSKTSFTTQYEQDLNMAIEQSMNDHKGIDLSSMEAINPNDRARAPGSFVGLKNIGNTCYVNSILQAYFMLPAFRNAVLALECNEKYGLRDKRRELQKLFSFLLTSGRKYIDPSLLISTFTNEQGVPIHIGDQEDPTEFNMIFLNNVIDSIRALRDPSLAHYESVGRDVVTKDAEKENKSEQANSSLANTDGYVGDLAPTAGAHGFEEVDLTLSDDDGRGSPQVASRYVSEEKPSNNFAAEEIEMGEIAADAQSKQEPAEQDEANKAPTFVDELLAGKTEQCMRAEEQNGEVVELKQEEEFMQIILDITQADFYSSLEDYTSPALVENFTTESGHQTNAERLVRFKELPAVLTFCLQRVVFDTELKRAVKKHSKFDFPKEVYMDRFLLQNWKAIEDQREIVAVHRQRKEEAEKELKKLTSYKGSECGLDFMLDGSCTFLEEEASKGAPVDGALAVLREYHSRICEEIASAEAQIKGYEEAISSAYDHMQDVKYRLHAVLVHDGEVSGGHYWVFIHNSDENEWYKYNDMVVTKVDEETVWKESIGGHRTTSAYCLIYVKAEMTGCGGLDDNYYQNVPLHLLEAVADDNAAFDEERKAWAAKQEQRTAQLNHRNSEPSLKTEADSTSVLEFFCGTLRGKLTELFNSFDPESDTFLSRLRSFEYFLVCMESHDLAIYEMTNKVHQEIFKTPLSESDPSFLNELAQEFPGLAIRLGPELRSQYDALRDSYRAECAALAFLNEGMEHFISEEVFAALNAGTVALQYHHKAPFSVIPEEEFRIFFATVLGNLEYSAQSKIMEDDLSGYSTYRKLAELMAPVRQLSRSLHATFYSQWKAFVKHLHRDLSETESHMRRDVEDAFSSTSRLVPRQADEVHALSQPAKVAYSTQVYAKHKMAMREEAAH